MSGKKLESILKKRKPLEDVEFREELGGSDTILQQNRYFACRELFCLDPLIKHLRTLRKPTGLFSTFLSLPVINVVSICFCKYCFALGMSDGTVVLIDPRAGDLLSYTMVS